MMGNTAMPSHNAEMTRLIPLVSVIIPFNNEEAFLQEAIDSVAVQEHTNWELLLVDDGSTDESTSIAKNAARQNPSNVRYLEHQGHCNRGPGPSRNLGLQHSSGEFIAFLDGDDLWFRDKLSCQVRFLLNRPDIDMVCARSLFWHFPVDDYGTDVIDFVHDIGWTGGAVFEPPILLTKLLSKENIHPTICGLLLRRQLCEDMGGFDERIAYIWEDTAFLAKAFLRARVVLSNECVAAYRIHRASSFHTCGNAEVTRTEFLSWLSIYLKEQKIDDAKLWRTVRNKLFRCRHARLYDAARILLKPALKWIGQQLNRGQSTGAADRFDSARDDLRGRQGRCSETADALRELAAVYRAIGRVLEANGIEERAQRILMGTLKHDARTPSA